MIKLEGHPVFFCAASMEGGDYMLSTLFEHLIAPLTVGVIIAFVTYWLSRCDKD